MTMSEEGPTVGQVPLEFIVPDPTSLKKMKNNMNEI